MLHATTLMLLMLPLLAPDSEVLLDHVRLTWEAAMIYNYVPLSTITIPLMHMY